MWPSMMPCRACTGERVTGASSRSRVGFGFGFIANSLCRGTAGSLAAPHWFRHGTIRRDPGLPARGRRAMQDDEDATLRRHARRLRHRALTLALRRLYRHYLLAPLP